MGDPEIDSGFVFDDEGRTDILGSPFFDVFFGNDETADDYLDRILYRLSLARGAYPTGALGYQRSTTFSSASGNLSGGYDPSYHMTNLDMKDIKAEVILVNKPSALNKKPVNPRKSAQECEKKEEVTHQPWQQHRFPRGFAASGNQIIRICDYDRNFEFVKSIRLYEREAVAKGYFVGAAAI
ncbi:hypothetical protein M5K25_012889 [Dendrobium thyrsiflorum]|uniref:Uncharacterized protein n=1 Tax=Dendrobium thyrsiflorum TaxID=117978 RepID=A0ABD0UZ27_DENTH